MFKCIFAWIGLDTYAPGLKLILQNMFQIYETTAEMLSPIAHRYSKALLHLLVLCDCMVQTIWDSARQNQQNGYAPSLIRVFAVRSVVAKEPSFLHATAKTLIRLGGYPGWSESSLGAQQFCRFYRALAHLILNRILQWLWLAGVRELT